MRPLFTRAHPSCSPLVPPPAAGCGAFAHPSLGSRNKHVRFVSWFYPGRPRGGLTFVPSRHLFQQVPTPIGGLCKSATPAPRWLAPLGASEHPLPLGRSVEKHFRVRRLGCPTSHPPTSHPSTPRSCISSGVAWLTSHVMRPSLGSNQSLLLRRVASRSHLLLSRQSRLLNPQHIRRPKGRSLARAVKIGQQSRFIDT